MTAQAAAPSSSSPLLASFRDSYRDLVAYFARRTGCPEEARDVAHDTWLRLADMDLRGSPPPLCEAEARAYVFTMARNLVTDRRRHDSVAQRHAQALLGVGQGVPDESEALMYRQAIDAVEAALATVPERARQVFLRHRVNGEDQGALAAEFGISRNMVERDMMLAMDRVQVAMERWHGGASATVRQGRRRALSTLLGVAGLAVPGAFAWRWWRIAVPEWQQAAATGHGQTLRQPLPDGGSVTLDAQSRVQLAYYAAGRSARLLAGAAFFEVTRDAQRPFVVDVPGAQGGVRITVLGTRFGVERLPGRCGGGAGRIGPRARGSARCPGPGAQRACIGRRRGAARGGRHRAAARRRPGGPMARRPRGVCRRAAGRRHRAPAPLPAAPRGAGRRSGAAAPVMPGAHRAGRGLRARTAFGRVGEHVARRGPLAHLGPLTKI